MSMKIKNHTNSNILKVENAFFDLLIRNKMIPTVYQLCKESGLSRTFIKKHLKDLPVYQIRPEIRKLLNDTIARHGKEAEKSGKDREQKVFEKLVNDLRSRESIQRVFLTQK